MLDKWSYRAGRACSPFIRPGKPNFIVRDIRECLCFAAAVIGRMVVAE